jgi:hypothetical protein
MRDDKSASRPKKKGSRAFYPELRDEVAWFDSLFSAKVTHRGGSGGGAAKNRDLAHFRNVVKNIDLPARIESRRELR